MALFKIHKGNEINLPSKATEGFAYFTEDKGHFFVDVASSDGVMFPEMNGDANACTHSLLLKHGYRVQLNAKEADFSLIKCSCPMRRKMESSALSMGIRMFERINFGGIPLKFRMLSVFVSI